MATFYLLPPRSSLEHAVGELFGKLLPGLAIPADAWEMATQLFAAAGWPDSVYLVPRDELPEGEPGAALRDYFGADPGDRVVEVSLARPPREWMISDCISECAPTR